MKKFSLKTLTVLCFLALICCREEEPIIQIPEDWQNIILGEYEGGLEIFCDEDSLYMENIDLTINKNDECYALIINSKIKLSVDCIKLSVLSIEDNLDENDVVFIDIHENQFYKTKEVGAYKNVIYINDILYNEAEGPNAEIRLSLICLTQDNIRHIFIRAKRFL